MKLVTINADLLKRYSVDPEVLHKTGRPCVWVVRLKYKGKRHDFAVPIRSNIPASAPKKQYFSLPPRATTKPRNRHGLHYIKMFPVNARYMMRYRTEGNAFATLIANILKQNEKRIIGECQEYLDDYSAGVHPPYSTDIDLLLQQLSADDT